MSVDDPIFQEVFHAIEEGDRARARDLLTRLLRTDKNNPDCWLWMSAVVDTSKERIYCLKEVLRLDPANAAARRGLILLGAAPRDPDLVVPLQNQRRAWQTPIARQSDLPPVSWKRIALYAGAGVAALALILVAVFGSQLVRKNASLRPTISYLPGVNVTATREITAEITRSGAENLPTAPWDTLSATYTPTPAAGRTPHPLTEAYSLAVRAMERQDWGRVETYIQQALEADPNSPDLYYLLGETYRSAGKLNEALTAYNNALEISNTYAPVYLGRALVYAHMEAASEQDVRNDLETALQLDSSLGEASLELARLDLAAGEPAAALEFLEKAAQTLPDSPLLFLYRAQAELALGEDAGAALADAQQAVERDVTRVDAYLTLGQAYQAAGDLEASIEPLEIYARYAPAVDGAVYRGLGSAYAAGGANAQALKAFDQALDLNARDIAALTLRGALYAQSEDWPAARADYETALKLQPTSFEIAAALSRVYLAQEAYGEAYTQLNKSEAYAESDAQLAELYYLRAQAVEPLSVPAAIRDWESLLALPAEAAPADWLVTAEEHLSRLWTPTPTITRTSTVQTSATRTPAARTPARTPTPTRKP